MERHPPWLEQPLSPPFSPRPLFPPRQVWGTVNWSPEGEGSGASSESRFRALPPKDLLYQLPQLQRLQRRLMDCVPRGQASHDPVVLVSGS
jgi:hypothetical protein